jgi:hypothetical protein
MVPLLYPAHIKVLDRRYWRLIQKMLISVSFFVVYHRVLKIVNNLSLSDIKEEIHNIAVLYSVVFPL